MEFATITPGAVSAALSGDKVAMRSLVCAATPVIRARVAKVALRSRRASLVRGDDLDDIAQEVFTALFERDAKVLREWDPLLGSSFRNYIGLIAHRRAISILRAKTSQRHNAALHDIDETASEYTFTPERTAAAREVLSRIWQRIETAVSERGQELFQRLYVADDAVAEVCAELSLSEEAAYQWRRRLRSIARAELDRML